MNASRSKQYGFGGLAVVLLLVIVSIIGFTGWYVWHSTKVTDKTLKQTGMAADSAAPEVVKKPAVKVSNAVDPSIVEKRQFSTVSPELQSAILNYTKSTASDCVINEAIVDFDKKPLDQEISYAGAGSAITGIGCSGSAATLFVRRDSGNWEMVEKTQMGFSCETLKTNKVPVELLSLSGAGGQCFDEQSNYVDYKG